VEIEAGVAEQPPVDLGGLVRRGVVNDEMDIEIGGDRSVDEVQNRLNSSARWQSVMDEMTWPDATSRAA
jgi:hypothetical protein